MNIVLGIIVGLLVLMSLIVAHEFGHFLVAKKNGVRVIEFGIGFPPRLKAWLHVPPKNPKSKGKDGKWTWKRLDKKNWDKPQDSLIFSLNALPIGGFCAMDGESDDDDRKGTFGAASYWKKTKILFAGVTMNWLVAFLIFTVLCWTGLPDVLTNQFSIKSDERVFVDAPVIVTSIMKDSPAESSGFKVGDKILSVRAESGASASVVTSTDVINFNAAHPGETLSYGIIRPSCERDCYQEPCECTESDLSYNSANAQTIEATLNSTESEYLLGITMARNSATYRYTWSAPVVAAGLTVQLTGETFKGLWNLVVNLITGAARQVSLDSSVREAGREQISEASEGVSGIVGIIGGYFPGIISSGPTYIFLFMAIISVSLACMNVLPIPALDGGRWFMITIARFRHKKLSKETEQKIVTRAFIFLLILMVIVTIMDVIRLF